MNKMEKRNFYKELEGKTFIPITFALFNKIDDDCVIKYWQSQKHELYDIDDLEYYQIELNDKEKFLLKMHNKDFLKQIVALQSNFKDKCCVVEVNYDYGGIYVIKLKNEDI